MKRDIARELFRAYRSKSPKQNPIEDLERGNSDEPTRIDNLLNELVEKRDWRKGISEGNLFSNWNEIVGLEIANHSEPITLLDGRLTIKAKSTAWATQLRLLAPELLKEIQSKSAGALVEELQILAPSAPSWRRGARTIKGGRGPRDTYG